MLWQAVVPKSNEQECIPKSSFTCQTH